MEPDALAAERLLQAVGAVRRRTRRAVGGPLQATPLTSAQAELIRLVRREPGIGISRAAEALGLAPNTVSTLVRQLSELGHLRRESDPEDARAARLQLTVGTRRTVELWRDRRTALVAEAVASLPPERRAELDDAVALIEYLALRIGES